MATQKREVKLSELHVEELTSQVNKANESLFKLRFRASTAPIKNTMQIRGLRREIARLKTFINQKNGSKKAS